VTHPVLDGAVIPAYDIPLEEGKSLSSIVFSRKTPLRFDREDDVFKNQAHMPPRTIPLPDASSYLFIPLMLHKGMTGILNLESRKDKAYSSYEEKIVTALAPFIAVAVENAVTYDEITRRHRATLQEKQGLEKSINKISHLAHHDPLTQLPNRYLLEHILQDVLEDKDPEGAPTTALAYLDLDGFKPVNDTLGHLAGDQVLRMVAERISGVIRDTDTVGRIGGDEFIFILGVADRPVVERICRSLIKVLSQPFAVEETPVKLGGSIGVALYPTDGTDGSTLLRAADLAMYQAKKEGKNRFCFAEGLTPQDRL
jgi:diguanylate cyclase (GGDEF)-like protein